jgi:HEPN domain-containing protein
VVAPCGSFEEAELLRLRAEAFLRNAERLYAEGEYDSAALGVEQYCQLMLKYKLLLKTGAYPHTHFLIRLVRKSPRPRRGPRRWRTRPRGPAKERSC